MLSFYSDFGIFVFAFVEYCVWKKDYKWKLILRYFIRDIKDCCGFMVGRTGGMGKSVVMNLVVNISSKKREEVQKYYFSFAIIFSLHWINFVWVNCLVVVLLWTRLY